MFNLCLITNSSANYWGHDLWTATWSCIILDMKHFWTHSVCISLAKTSLADIYIGMMKKNALKCVLIGQKSLNLVQTYFGQLLAKYCLYIFKSHEESHFNQSSKLRKIVVINYKYLPYFVRSYIPNKYLIFPLVVSAGFSQVLEFPWKCMKQIKAFGNI